MARKRKVGFLQQFNGPRVIGPFRVDVILVVILSFVLIYTVLILASVTISITMLSSFALTFFATKLYIKAKEKASKGFLWHLLYVSGIWSVKEDSKKYEELNRMDVKNYIPDCTDKIFYD
ncbi:hypothetical protein CP985_03475 [Malaciobacter mytili LMG 24559]|uniref:Type IV conjugative transfer system protein TraL n=1 Tax=Malaciobacter mytili LMG 24559 TaxID=1032238 RepID=A0AAX2AJY7_9BACT|nr:hypothetical protein [Malaciobacter mytili]AXH16419.1 hypothetical protein AMYT_a0121 [Malaciobacter mytili LMG 24559]RXK16485.1 hypothetical protein CP985_03475 [Malaciobacter mytili LMG 24559]